MFFISILALQNNFHYVIVQERMEKSSEFLADSGVTRILWKNCFRSVTVRVSCDTAVVIFWPNFAFFLEIRNMKNSCPDRQQLWGLAQLTQRCGHFRLSRANWPNIPVFPFKILRELKHTQKIKISILSSFKKLLRKWVKMVRWRL